MPAVLAAWATPKRVHQAREMWLAGATTLAIAAACHCTKNAIIGFARRSGWPRRRSPITRKAEPLPKTTSPEALLRPIRPLVATSAASRCQWIIEIERPFRTFCGEPTVLGGSWCDVHHRVVFIRPPRWRDEQLAVAG